MVEIDAPKFNLFAVGAFPPALGGGERQGWTIARQLAKAGHSLTIFSQEIAGKEPPIAQNVRFVTFPTQRQVDVSPKDFSLARPISGYLNRHVAREPLRQALMAEISRARPDAIIVNFGAPWASFVMPIAKKMGIPVITIIHGSDAHALTRPEYRKTRKAVVRSYSKSDAKIAVADYLKSTLDAMGVKNIEVIRNTIDAKKFGAIHPEKSGFWRKRFNIPKNATVFVHVSYLAPVKNPLLIVQAASLAVQKNPEMHFLIVGEGPLRQAMEKMVKTNGLSKKFTFTGEATHSQIRNYFSFSNVHIMSSLREGTPLVIMEAAAAGLPTIATRAGGIPEIVLDGHNGFLVEQENAAQMAEKMLEISDPKILKRMSRSSRQWANGMSIRKYRQRLNETIARTIENAKAKKEKPRRFWQRKK
ncbi:MAG: glycosyltransferase family 4 protein [archaeon]|nr:glycosyltransferase family 4 protein [archaeon]